MVRFVVVIGLVWMGACSGPSFQPSDCEDDECAGASSGGRATGGASRGGTGGAGEGGEPSGGTDTGGASTGGSNEGGTDTGGSSSGGTDAGGTNAGGTNAGGSSGSGMSGSAGTAGTVTTRFPTTPVLDAFNRPAGVGENWMGATDVYEIYDLALLCQGEYCPGVFWYQAFGVVQEVFATLVQFSEYSPEINLVFKAQGNVDCDLIEVFYAPSREEVLIEACWNGDWNTFGTVAVRFEQGDQLGGRVRSDGFIEIFRNGELLHTVDATDYPYIDSDGYIGVNGIVGPGEAPNAWDDFGGGSLEP